MPEPDAISTQVTPQPAPESAAAPRAAGRATLAVVATPIGNLGDLTARAADTLRGATIVLAEDTRVTGRLLQHIDAKGRMVALHEHNERARIEQVRGWLDAGESVALVSDAGTPLISDPGFVLVRALQDSGYAVTPIPGACALIAALSASGLPTDRFCFEGFLPAKSGARRTALEALREEPRTLVFYEAPHRIAATLADMADVLGQDRPALLARELTKRFETLIRAPLADLAARVAADTDQQRGESVLVIGGAPAVAADGQAALGTVPVDADALLATLMTAMPTKQAVKQVAGLTGLPRNAVYERALALKNG